jgi:hypothetical protein
MIDSAAATHLCPPWFGTSLLPLHAHHFVGSVVCVCACLAGLVWALQLSNLHSQQTSHLSQGFACCVCTSNSAAKELRNSKRSCFFRWLESLVYLDHLQVCSMLQALNG